MRLDTHYEGKSVIGTITARPSNYSSCFGKPGSTTVGQPPASKENGFNLIVNELNKKAKSGLHLTSKQIKEQFKTYQSRYGKAKKESSSTGFGLTEEDQSKGIITISQKLNLMCPCYEQIDHIFGSLCHNRGTPGTITGILSVLLTGHREMNKEAQKI
ncbi:hypothetical protein PPACK8108_LOCUS20218 [Phakopsora pachyrhizi]|uniref:Uncharacterized protein n=1 Tax=Phakopsora pachyrhizi TaxID=170000 RepID=A0AAV0BHV1_PHAPC|nr:hypothetical protein PPACK8108_LOCUS20218 [Phakopsora pachyrhizi]